MNGEGVKRCTKCGEEKPVGEVHMDPTQSDGRARKCVPCVREYGLVYRATRRQKILERQASYRAANREVLADKSRARYAANREQISSKMRDYRTANRERIRAWLAANHERIAKRQQAYRIARRAILLKAQREYWARNREKISARQKAWRAANREKISARQKDWRAANREKINRAKRVWQARRCIADPKFKLAGNLRNRLNTALKNGAKSGSAVRDLGCSIEFLKEVLERLFEPGMTWENYGTAWHIDHTEPLASFDLEDREQLLKACNWSNLYPRWADYNLSKGARPPTDEEVPPWR